jgi:3-deoxy-D-manno-octulosonate 8-phosphate phosphatase (KDO 8-P phosphatase)
MPNPPHSVDRRPPPSSSEETSPPYTPAHQRDASKIELLVLDVDGVLTDGSIVHGPDHFELKRFNTKDGFGLRLWAQMGLRAGIITGRSSAAVATRSQELGLNPVIQGSKNKDESFSVMLTTLGLTADRACVMGDDWPDIRIMRRAGYAIAPADAAPEVVAIADHVTRAAGGRGAVREAVEHLLRARGLFDRARSLYD